MVGGSVVVAAMAGLFGCGDGEKGSDCLHSDCGGTYCDVDADCPSPRVCTKEYQYQSDYDGPLGCRLPAASAGAPND
jgi:hypothetical protein